MTTFAEVVNRALTGPRCPEKDYDLQVFSKKLMEIVREHKIVYDRETKIPSDDSLADEVFEAAIELYSEVGTYCTTTGRIIKFTEEEIKEAVRGASPSINLGEGRDEKAFVARKPESETPPWCSLGGCGITVSSEEIFLSLTQALGSIPLADSITTNCLMTVNGKRVLMDTPLEIFAAVRTVALTKEALRRAGRPGLPVANGIASAISDVATIAGGAYGLGPGDVYEISSTAEMKVDLKLLNKVAHALNMGGKIVAGYGPILGGYCGGPEGLAVAVTAYTFQNLLILRGAVNHPYPVHYLYTANSGSNMIWATGLSYQAISRNVNLPLLCVCYASSGPATEMAFYEAAATVTATVVSGGSIEALGLKGNKIDYSCSLEPAFAAEVAHAVAGMKREDANEVLKNLLPTYEGKLRTPPEGKRYQDCYDIATANPSEEYRDLYKRMKNEVADCGIPLE